MSTMRKALGIDGPELVEGFRKNTRAGDMPVCEECGALVSYESQATHLRWHRALEGSVAAE